MEVHKDPGTGLGTGDLGDGRVAREGPPLDALRYNEGKPAVHLVAPSILTAIGRVSKMGADKYGERNWERGFRSSQVYASLLRHLISWWEGSDIDPESKLSELDHIAWNVHVLVEQERRMRLGTLPLSADDRPKNVVPGYDPNFAMPIYLHNTKES